MSKDIGNLIERPSKMIIEWRLFDFLSLPSELDKGLWSPVFFFAGLAWRFALYPKGESRNQTEEFVGLYLHRKSSGPPKTVTYSLGLRKADGEEEVIHSLTYIFDKVDGSFGLPRFIRRSNLIKRQDQLAPEDTLTVTCTLSAADGHSLDASLSTRLWNLSRNLATLMSTREDADVKLKLLDGELDAHEMILKSRSSVFGSMFSHDDLKECQTGEVKIEDGDKKSFQVALAYIYTGDPQGLLPENVQDVYKLSHKYNLCDLTRCCSEFMQAGISLDTICDVITIADLYQDKKLMDSAKDYFVKHKGKIIKSDQWKALKADNLEIVCEILEYTAVNA